MFTKSEIRFLQNTSKKDKVNIFIVCTYMLNFTTKNRLCPSNLEHLFLLFISTYNVTLSLLSIGTTATIKDIKDQQLRRITDLIILLKLIFN